MLTEEQKAVIIERLQFEKQIRKELQDSSEDKQPKFGWLQSKLGLLLMGGLLTGILVPMFQYTQETVNWKRQNRFENTKYRLTMMRDGLKEFVFAHAYVAEAYERARPFLDDPTVTKKDFELYKSQKLDMQNRRFQQNAKFASFLIYFSDKYKGQIRKAYNDYLRRVEQYLNTLQAISEIRYELSQSRSSNEQQLQEKFSQLQGEINNSIDRLNQDYESLLQMMKQQIGEREDESEGYM